MALVAALGAAHIGGAGEVVPSARVTPASEAIRGTGVHEDTQDVGRDAHEVGRGTGVMGLRDVAIGLIALTASDLTTGSGRGLGAGDARPWLAALDGRALEGEHREAPRGVDAGRLALVAADGERLTIWLIRMRYSFSGTCLIAVKGDADRRCCVKNGVVSARDAVEPAAASGAGDMNPGLESDEPGRWPNGGVVKETRPDGEATRPDGDIPAPGLPGGGRISL